MTGNIRIALDNYQALYFPGQNVTGKVQVRTHETLTIKGISIKFSGESQTQWQLGGGAKKRKGGLTQSAREVYYVKSDFLLGNGSDTEQLNPGEHIFHFSFRLPMIIPSSYETLTGQVRHQCRARLHYPSGSDIRVVRPFSVNTLYDLNLDENAKLPVEKKHKQGFTISSGSMAMTLLMARTGFVPGEKLRIHLEVHNDSTKNINCITLKFIKDVIYHAKGGATKRYSMNLAKQSKDNITAPGTQVVWSDTGPIVPALPPSYLQYCSLIDIRYKLKIILFPSGFSKSHILEQPIIIGSIPLREHFTLYSMISSRRTTQFDEDSSATGATAAVHSASAPMLSDSDAPPPYDPSWMHDDGGETPVFPGFDNYPEMPPPSFISSNHSTHIRYAANSNGTPQNPFIPSYLVFNPNDSRPSTPTVQHRTKCPEKRALGAF